MLVLTRKLHETIRIGPDITITIVRVKGNTVRVGIEAPDSVRVVRGELVDLPPRESQRAGDPQSRGTAAGEYSAGADEGPAVQGRGRARRRMPAVAPSSGDVPPRHDPASAPSGTAITEAGSRVRALLARRSRCFRPAALVAPLCQ
jgi:carbon storage regulator